VTSIGLAGPGGVGKTTTARAMEKLDPRVKLVSISDPLKEMLRALYRSTTDLPAAEVERRLNGDLKRSPCGYLAGKTPTEAMQTLGTEWGRDAIHAEFWLQAWQRSAVRFALPVNDSIRFANEAAAVDVVVRLVGRGNLTSSHISEHGSFPVHHTIRVDAEPEAIARKVLELVGI
jgi:hypothetical protein